MDLTPEQHTQYAIKQLKDQAVTARLVGWKPHMAALSAEHASHLLRQRVISLPKNADGVRLRMELTTGKLSRHSHNVICNLI